MQAEKMFEHLNELKFGLLKNENFITYIGEVDKINVLYAGKEITSEEAMQGILLLSGKLSRNLEKLNQS